jgi:hypothetical protein
LWWAFLVEGVADVDMLRVGSAGRERGDDGAERGNQPSNRQRSSLVKRWQPAARFTTS